MQLMKDSLLNDSELYALTAAFLQVNRFSSGFEHSDEIRVIPRIIGNVIPGEDAVVTGRESVKVYAARTVGAHCSVQI